MAVFLLVKITELENKQMPVSEFANIKGRCVARFAGRTQRATTEKGKALTTIGKPISKRVIIILSKFDICMKKNVSILIIEKNHGF